MKIHYARELINKVGEKNRIPLVTFEEKDISDKVIWILRNNEEFRKTQVFGDPRLGAPIEYEKLVVVDDEGERTFEYFNKGIHYMTQDGEQARQVFQVFAFFMSRHLETMPEP
jgi:hypothetical protein